MKLIGAAITALALCGCVTSVEDYYPADSDASWVVPAHTHSVIVRTSTGHLRGDVAAMFTDGYGVLGYYYFSGPTPTIEQAIATARQVGATAVVADASYTRAVASATPLTAALSEAAYANDADIGEGVGADHHAHPPGGYDRVAVLFAPVRRIGFGYLPRLLTPREAQSTGTAQGVYVRAVYRGSPADQVGILPGDILIDINGVPADQVSPLGRSLRRDELNRVLIDRAGLSLQKDVLVRSDW